MFSRLLIWLQVNRTELTIQNDKLRKKAAPVLAAFFFWSSFLAVSEGNQLSHIVGLLCLSLLDGFGISLWRKFAWVALCALAAFNEPVYSIFIFATYFYLRNDIRLATLALSIGIISHIGYSHFLVATQNVIPPLGNLPLASAGFIVIGGCSMASGVWLLGGLTPTVRVIGLFVLTWAILDVTAQGNWISPAIFTSEWFRLTCGMLPAFMAISTRSNTRISSDPRLRQLIAVSFGVAAMLAALMTSALTNPIHEIVFDEAHGNWETTTTEYRPESFGRNTTYTYKLLFDYSSKISTKAVRFRGGALPATTDALFVVKMPTERFSQSFLSELVAWVKAGGRLLVVADHTDLFDTTQNLTPLLAALDAGIAPTATYNRDGKPTQSFTGVGSILLGSVLGVRAPFSFLTGATFSAIPWNAAILGAYGLSFAEEAVYFRPNRFGYFLPDLQIPFGNHPALIAYSYGTGSVAIIGDSTPWSNFALFRGEYVDLFRNIVAVLERPLCLRIYGVALALSFLFTLLSLIIPNRLLTSLSFFTIGLLISSNLSISAPTLFPAKTPRDFSANVILGGTASVEILPQMVRPGSDNFARILSSLAKYDVHPRVSATSTQFDEKVPINILIHPDPAQLPLPEIVLRYTKAAEIWWFCLRVINLTKKHLSDGSMVFH